MPPSQTLAPQQLPAAQQPYNSSPRSRRRRHQRNIFLGFQLRTQAFIIALRRAPVHLGLALFQGHRIAVRYHHRHRSLWGRWLGRFKHHYHHHHQQPHHKCCKHGKQHPFFLIVLHITQTLYKPCTNTPAPPQGIRRRRSTPAPSQGANRSESLSSLPGFHKVIGHHLELLNQQPMGIHIGATSLQHLAGRYKRIL